MFAAQFFFEKPKNAIQHDSTFLTEKSHFQTITCLHKSQGTKTVGDTQLFFFNQMLKT